MAAALIYRLPVVVTVVAAADEEAEISGAISAHDIELGQNLRALDDVGAEV